MTNIFKNLIQEELTAANEWHQRLREEEQASIGSVVAYLDDWVHGKLGRRSYNPEEGPFFVLYAIGSTLTEEENPEDVDLLLVTNLYFNMAHHQRPSVSDLIEAIRQEFEIGFDEELDKAYATAPDSRVRIILTPLERRSRNIDLVVQYDVISEDRWAYNDRFPAVPLSRYGRHDPGDEKYWKGMGEGWGILPMTEFLKHSRL